MSRFFNQSRKLAAHVTPGFPGGSVVERVSKLKEAMEAERHPAESVSEAHLKQMLTPLDNSDKTASAVVAARLANCGSIRLLRDDGKSLLAPSYNPSMQQAVEAYQRLRAALVKCQDKHGTRSLVVSSPGPREGKTLTTFNLALCFARIQNWPVLIVDADLRTRGLSRLLGDPHSVGLGKVLESGCPYDAAILRTDVPNLYALLAGEVSVPAPELFSRAGWKELVAWSSECFKLVLVDSPPALNLADFELITAPCEGVMLIARSGNTSRDSLTRTCARIDPKKLMGAVLNVSDDKKENGHYYSYQARIKR